ncbi:hypothetical protein PUN28_013142 [Cardiocondyla obscurior]|uniref:L-serine deaminase n=3 Tax=Cardiocondyla obscurior TaxID=286306 RepID=A0AAW2F781_9HYME
MTQSSHNSNSTLKKTEATRSQENRILPFTYNVVCPPVQSLRLNSFIWTVMEKGSIQTNSRTKFHISLSKIRSAQFDIRPYFLASRRRQTIINKRGNQIYMRRDSELILENIKERGVIYTMLQLTTEQKRRGVVTFTIQKFADIVCHYGVVFNIPVTIVVPNTLDPRTIREYQNLNARVIGINDFNYEAHNKTLEIAQSNGLYYIGYDDPNMLIGQATLGLDIIHQVKNIDAVVIPTTKVNCPVAMSIAIAIKEFKPDITVIEARYKHMMDHVCFYENVRRQATSDSELNIPVTEYRWYYSTRSLEELFDRVVEIDMHRMLQARNVIRRLQEKVKRRRSKVDSINAGIGYAPFLTDKLNDIKGKRIVIPLYE